VQRLVVSLLIRFNRPLTKTPRQSEQAAPAATADAAKYHLTRPHISGQSTAFLTRIRAVAAAQRPSSLAAESVARNERKAEAVGGRVQRLVGLRVRQLQPLRCLPIYASHETSDR